ncbi:MAG: hypothetical protein RLZZ210_1853, partial [Pseudomonadota bacterium]
IKADNLLGLKYLINEKKLSNKIDLIYIDPPFSTNIDFIFNKDRVSTISSPKKGLLAYSDKLLGNEFIEFLRERLILLKELLSDKGSIYLHIDYKIGHYVKILMDEIFGINNFKNDISRIKCNPKNFDRVGYSNIKDLILFYTVGSNPIWNEPKEKYTEKEIVKLFPKINYDGRRYTTVPIHAPGETKGNTSQPFRNLLPPKGRHWRTKVEILEQWDMQGLIEWSSNGNPRKIIFADEKEGKRVQDIWEYKDPQYPIYPTEKNSDLLERIVTTSSNQDSIILDCFCGSGTTLKAASVNNRYWIGIDSSEHAIDAVKQKLDSSQIDLFNMGYDFISL